MRLRVLFALLALTLAASGSVLAQTRVRTEAIKRPTGPVITPRADQFVPPPPGGGAGTVNPQGADAAPPPAELEIVTDPSRLPEPVARMRERILKAAHSGDPQQVLALMQGSGSMPVFSRTQKLDPTVIWKQAYPDSGGVEALSILITILDTGVVRIDAGTPQETYLWPYFAKVPLKTLTPEQKVDLFRVVTGADYQDMLEGGRYVFYRVGIGPDGTWRYFVSDE